MQASHVFLAVAGIGATLAGLGLVLFFRKHFQPSQEAFDVEPGQRKLPPAPLQKRALWGLTITILTTVAVVFTFIARDASLYYEDKGTRLLVLGIIIAGALAYGVVVLRTRFKDGPDSIILDERDRMIIARAPAVQLNAVLISLVIWCVALTEVYWDSGAIPIFYPYLMFWATYAVSILAWCLGILIGYHRL
jgi:hypothetical protein